MIQPKHHKKGCATKWIPSHFNLKLSMVRVDKWVVRAAIQVSLTSTMFVLTSEVGHKEIAQVKTGQKKCALRLVSFLWFSTQDKINKQHWSLNRSNRRKFDLTEFQTQDSFSNSETVSKTLNGCQFLLLLKKSNGGT